MHSFLQSHKVILRYWFYSYVSCSTISNTGSKTNQDNKIWDWHKERQLYWLSLYHMILSWFQSDNALPRNWSMTAVIYTKVAKTRKLWSVSFINPHVMKPVRPVMTAGIKLRFTHINWTLWRNDSHMFTTGFISSWAPTKSTLSSV